MFIFNVKKGYTHKGGVMDFSKMLRELRQKRGLSQEELADAIGVTRISVYKWEKGQTLPTVDKAYALANALKTSVHELMGEEQLLPIEAVVPKGSSAFVPMLELGTIHAGEPIEPIGDEVIVEVPLEVAKHHDGAFMLKVQGNCMNKRYPEGCHVLIDPHMEPTNGDAVAVMIDNENVLLRTYYKGNSALMLCADSYEDKYDDIIFDEDNYHEVTLVGVVCWFQAYKQAK